MTPGQRIAQGTRQPPSQLVSFSPRNTVVPPSGQDITSAPLSVEYITIVLSVIPSSSSLASNCPTCRPCSTIPSAVTPNPVTPSHSFFKCVQMCILVEFHQQKNGLSALCWRSMKSRPAAVISSSMVSIRFLLSGPVSSIFCVPSGFAQECRTPRGPKCFLNSGFF